MTTQLEKMLQETLGDLKELSNDKVHGLINEALKTFLTLKEKSHSADPKEREEAQKTALSLKQAIQAQTEEVCKEAGVDPSFLNALSENQDLFTPETWAELSTARKELEEFRNELGVKLKKTTHGPKKAPKVWLPG